MCVCSVPFRLKCVSIFNKMKAIERFYVAMFIVLFKAVLSIKSLVDTLVPVTIEMKGFLIAFIIYFLFFAL